MGLAIRMPWMLTTLHDFTERIFNPIPMFVQ